MYHHQPSLKIHNIIHSKSWIKQRNRMSFLKYKSKKQKKRGIDW